MPLGFVSRDSQNYICCPNHKKYVNHIFSKIIPTANLKGRISPLNSKFSAGILRYLRTDKIKFAVRELSKVNSAVQHCNLASHY